MTFEFSTEASAAASHLAELSLREDLAGLGDLTSEATIPEQLSAAVRIVGRQAGVLAGIGVIPLVFRHLPGRVRAEVYVADGEEVEAGTVVAELHGPVRTLLTGERTVLNFLTHLSGIATRTAEFVRAVRGTSARILDTRKTLPGYRLLQKYAVRCGGGHNHRLGLYDGMLIKDNHLAARGASSCAGAVRAAREYLRGRDLSVPVEIEVDTLEQLRDALSEHPELVLLDNMSPEMLCQAVAIRNEQAPRTQLEASGGVNLHTVRAIAETGVDRISVGSLTHSSPSLDLAFDWPW
ncbi:MAG: Nicotinate-nucleotide pyrophosphorylase [Planctomycetota bacterium]|jgi:nicotinate-nucleotide pyrophosphorylase (carboxylating)